CSAPAPRGRASGCSARVGLVGSARPGLADVHDHALGDLRREQPEEPEQHRLDRVADREQLDRAPAHRPALRSEAPWVERSSASATTAPTASSTGAATGARPDTATSGAPMPTAPASS